MGRMNEAAMQQEEQENLSGMNDCEQWEYEQSIANKSTIEFVVNGIAIPSTALIGG